MPHHKSAKKRVRQTIVKTAANKSQKTRTRNSIKKVRAAIEEGNKELAVTLLSTAQSLLARLSKKGIVKAGFASRITSRLSSQIKKIA